VTRAPRAAAARALAAALGGACAVALAGPAARAAEPPTCPVPTQRTETLDAPAPAPGSCPFLPPATAAWPEEWNVTAESFPVGTTLEWELPPGVSGMTVTLEAVDAVPEVPFVHESTQVQAPNSAFPIHLTAPGGTPWWLIDLTREESYVALRGPRAAVGSLQIPNTSLALDAVADGGLPAGRWSMMVGDLAYGCAIVPPLNPFCGTGAGLDPPPDLDAYRAGQYRVSVRVRTGAIPDQGTVDLAFYLHRSFDDRPLRAADAPSDPDVQRMLTSLGAFLGRAGLCVGEVTWIDLPDWAQDRWAGGVNTHTTCEGSSAELFSLGGAGARVNVFLVPAVTFGDESAYGFTSAYPGTPGLSNTIHSGIAGSTEDLRTSTGCGAEVHPSACGPDVVAMTVAHELGHFLGLFHPTERDGNLFDPLDDTPTCDCRACAPEEERAACEEGSFLLFNPYCDAEGTACAGARNLMFWALWTAEGAPPVGELTPEQGTVLRANPLVRWPQPAASADAASP